MTPLSGAYAEVLAFGVCFLTACITAVTFWNRVKARAAPLNTTGLVASLMSIFYSCFGLVYWFNGIDGFDCTWLQV